MKFPYGIANFHQVSLRSHKSSDRGLLLDIVQGNRICVNSLKDRFSILDILYIGERDISSRVSYLYYFGVLTLAEKTVLEYCFEVPNLVINGLYVERIREFLSDGIVQDEGMEQAKEFLLGGDIKPLCGAEDSACIQEP